MDFEEYVRNLEKRLNELEQERKQVEEDLRKAKEVYQRFKAFSENEENPILTEQEYLRRKFEGLSIRKCLQIIARENDNVLDITEARTILYKADRMTKNLSADIVRNPEFLKTGRRGIYKFDESKIETGSAPAQDKNLDELLEGI